MKAKEGLWEVSVPWVKAHQDDIKQFKDLTLDTHLNGLADADINKFRANTPPNLLLKQTPTIFPSNHNAITINGVVAT
eukprot:2521181-Ditylum_brightwellii.AAC.1